MTTPTPDGNCAKLLHDIAVELKALEQARERYSPQLAPFEGCAASKLWKPPLIGDYPVINGINAITVINR